jgi:hypothetical protein
LPPLLWQARTRSSPHHRISNPAHSSALDPSTSSTSYLSRSCEGKGTLPTFTPAQSSPECHRPHGPPWPALHRALPSHLVLVSPSPSRHDAHVLTLPGKVLPSHRNTTAHRRAMAAVGARTWSGSSTSPQPSLLALLGPPWLLGADAHLSWPSSGRSSPVHHCVPPPSHHARRRDLSSSFAPHFPWSTSVALGAGRDGALGLAEIATSGELPPSPFLPCLISVYLVGPACQVCARGRDGHRGPRVGEPA